MRNAMTLKHQLPAPRRGDLGEAILALHLRNVAILAQQLQQPVEDMDAEGEL